LNDTTTTPIHAPSDHAQTTAGMSQAEDPVLLHKEQAHEVSVEDVRRLMGASTPHFALQLRNRIARLIAGLPAGDPARLEGEREIARLERLGREGELRGEAADTGERPLPSLGDGAAGADSPNAGASAGAQVGAGPGLSAG
jgi:hypothetical protein